MLPVENKTRRGVIGVSALLRHRHVRPAANKAS